MRGELMSNESVQTTRIEPAQLTGTIAAVASKSVAHRLLILAALTDGATDIDCTSTSADIEATVTCLRRLGARIAETRLGFRVVGIPNTRRRELPAEAGDLDCGESGSTLRFLLPVVAALGEGGRFMGHGRLAARPLSPLYEQLVEHGAYLTPQGTFPLDVVGKLRGGDFLLPGNVSSQYVSGLLMAAPLLDEPTIIWVSEPVESLPYIKLTVRALAAFGVGVRQNRVEYEGRGYMRLEVASDASLTTPEAMQVEGDWSNAAFWLAAGALSATGVEVTGLDATTVQGDRAMLAALTLFGARVQRSRGSAACRYEGLHAMELDVSDVPDLVPPLAAVAAYARGTTKLKNAGRLRLKESDRLATVSAAINALGGNATVVDDDLVITGTQLTGGTVDAANDHRIAMMAAVMATNASGPVTVLDSGCVAKSYPAFWQDYASLGGNVLTLDASER